MNTEAQQANVQAQEEARERMNAAMKARARAKTQEEWDCVDAVVTEAAADWGRAVREAVETKWQ